MEREADHRAEHDERRGQRRERVPDPAGNCCRFREEEENDPGQSEQYAEPEQPEPVHLVVGRRRSDPLRVQSAGRPGLSVACHAREVDGLSIIGMGV